MPATGWSQPWPESTQLKSSSGQSEHSSKSQPRSKSPPVKVNAGQSHPPVKVNHGQSQPHLDVAVRQLRRHHEGAVGDAHTVVRLVLLLQPAQDGDGVGHAGLANQHLCRECRRVRMSYVSAWCMACKQVSANDTHHGYVYKAAVATTEPVQVLMVFRRCGHAPTPVKAQPYCMDKPKGPG